MSEQKRRRVIAGNWKMYKNQKQTRAFFRALKPLVMEVTDCDMVIAPPFTDIPAAVKAAKGTTIGIAAQDVYWEKEGAFTGEVSPGMLVEAGCGYCYHWAFGAAAVFWREQRGGVEEDQGDSGGALTPIVCIGEMLADREADNTEKVIEEQFKGSVGALTPEEFSRILIAYEPVWAIGTGRTATPEIAAAVHSSCGSAQQRSFRQAMLPRCGFFMAEASNPTI